LTDALGSHRHVVLAFITSREPGDPLATDVALDPGHPDFEQTGLRVRSTLRVHRLLTLSSTIIQRELGNLSPSLEALVSQAVRKLFEFENAQPPRSDPDPGSES
jgi:mRNA interferase MazF